jgi:hypothetical protein
MEASCCSVAAISKFSCEERPLGMVGSNPDYPAGSVVSLPEEPAAVMLLTGEFLCLGLRDVRAVGAIKLWIESSLIVFRLG